VVVDGRARLTDFWTAVFNPSTVQRTLHTVASCWAMGAFLMAGVGAFYFLRNRGSDVARASLRLGVVSSLVACGLVFLTGDRHAKQVARTQPAKFAAMEGLYTTTPGAPLILFALPPQQDGRRPGPELIVTNLTSFLAFGNFQAPVQGLNEFPREHWPPVTMTFLSFHNMVIVGNAMGLMALAGVFLLWRGRIEEAHLWQRLMVWSVPLPMIAIQLGWLTAEVGRQPWIVYGVLTTRESVSKVVGAPALVFSIALFTVIYLLLGALWVYLMRKEILHGPVGLPLPAKAPATPVAAAVPQEA
jgi:cytochrome d ubiquinol oxidase subunit I